VVTSQTVRGWRKGLGIALIASGCQFSDSSTGAETDTDDASSGTAGSSATATADPSGDSQPTSESQGSGPTSDTDAGGETSTDSDASSTTGPACEPFSVWVWAAQVPDDATTLVKTAAGELPPVEGERVTFLRARFSAEGAATIPFEVPCEDAVTVWGLTWDALGDDVSNADAYLAGIDVAPRAIEDEGMRWEYGCDHADAGWQWNRLRDTAEACEGMDAYAPVLEVGEHALHLANPEIISDEPEFNFTGLAAIVVTNDPAFDPLAEYDPNAE